MAMAKKKETLSLEEKLEQALVPIEKQPYEVPENWCWTYLTKGFCECKDSFRKPINASGRAERDGDIPYYGATGQVGWIDDYLTDEQLVLLGEDGAPFLDVIKDKAYMIEGKAWVNNHAHILKSYYGEVGNKYILNYLNVFNYNGYVNGTTRLKLTQASMNTIPVPMPPLAEQQRIVEQIESLFTKLDEAKEKMQEVLDSYQSRKLSMLYKAFEGELTEGWRNVNGVGSDSWVMVTINDIADVKGGKRVPKGMELVYENTGQPYIKAGNLKHGTVIDDGIMYVPDEVFKYIKNYTVNAGDVYITNVGACIGDCGVIPEKYDGANLTENAVKMTNLRCDSDFLALYLETSAVQQMIKGLIASATLGKLSIANIKTIEINLPTIGEQKEIVKKLKDVLQKEDYSKEQIMNVIQKIELMKKSILAKAFCGELGTNNPDEESSLGIIKKILLEKNNEESPRIQRKDIQEDYFVERSILEVLDSMGKLTPEKLKMETNFDIDTFYEELKELIDANKVIESRVNGEIYLEAKYEDR